MSGRSPTGLWGLEHGVNQHRVAIGNEMVFAREPLGPTGLTGMDIVRLGLERGRTAGEALAVMADLLGLCMHADPLDNTTAAMVARLPADPSALGTAWVCLGNPCVGAFLPCYPEGAVPDRLARGGAEPDPESPWWRMRELLTLVERDFGRWGPVARARWDAFEARLAGQAAGVEAEAEAARRAGRTSAAAAALTAFMERAVDAYQAEAEGLARELEG